MSTLPSKRVTVSRRWLGKPPDDIPRKQWPKKRRHTWVVRWFTVRAGPSEFKSDTICHRKSFKTRDEAEAFAHDKRAEYAGGATRHEPKRMTLGEYIEEVREHRTGAKGQRLRYGSMVEAVSALNRLARHIGEGTRLTDINKPQVIVFLRSLENAGKLSINTVAKIGRTLKAALSAACECGYLQTNPLLGIRLQTEESDTRYVTSTEFAAILTVARREADPLWWEAFCLTAYTSGLRLNELGSLTWADVDFERGEVKVTIKRDTAETLAWAPKTKPSLRSVPVPTEVIDLLIRRQEQAPEGYAYVFMPVKRFGSIATARDAGLRTEHNDPMDSVQRRFRRIVKAAAKIEPSLADRNGKATVSPHDLRKTAATNWSKHVNPQTLHRMTGHSNIATTMRYYSAVTDDQQECARQAAQAALGGLTERTSAKLAQTAIKGDKTTVAAVALSDVKDVGHTPYAERARQDSNLGPSD